MTDYKIFFESSDVYKHLLQGFKYDNLTREDLEKIDELIIHLCANNQFEKGRLCAWSSKD